MNSFNHILQGKNRRLREICVKSHQIQKLEAKIIQTLGDNPLATNIKVANIRDNCLVIEYSNANWATHGRFSHSEILDIAKSIYPEINSVDWYIRKN